jgi:hypothetical protein
MVGKAADALFSHGGASRLQHQQFRETRDEFHRACGNESHCHALMEMQRKLATGRRRRLWFVESLVQAADAPGHSVDLIACVVVRPRDGLPRRAIC